MRKIKMFYSIALLVSVFILYLYSAIYFKSAYSQNTNTTFYNLNSGWSYLLEDRIIFSDSFPSSLKADRNSSVTLFGRLPDEILDSDIIQFHTGHYNVWLYIDNVLAYENTAEHFSVSKTTGNVYHFINLDPSMAGKPFTIIYQSCYPKNTILLSPVCFGNDRDILHGLIINKLFGFIICALMFAIGCIGLMCYAVFCRQLPGSDSLFWLSIFALAFSCWSGLETQMMAILLPYHLAFSWYTFISLKLIPIPAIMFISYTYQTERSRLCKLLVILSGLDIILTSALQYTGLMDFKETLIFTHGIFFLSLIWIFPLSISVLHKQIKQPGSKKPKTMNQLHIIFISILAVTVIMDFISYYFKASDDSASFSRLALLAYIICLAIMIVQNSLDLQKTKEKANALRELAATDPLTKLKNRASFEKDIAAIPAKDQPSYGIAMFDLNKLKYFNDVHGHSTGDYYIIICSEILQDIFCPFGNVYRIGGDEFCAIMKNVSAEKYSQLSAAITSRIRNLHQTMYEYCMEVADGYAVYDAKLDKSLLHTMERADKSMYKKKQEMKAAARAAEI